MNEKQYTPYVPQNVSMREFTARALILGLIMTVILGAANAYLGLRAGMTIAATYPAAVIGMAILRIWRPRFWKRTWRGRSVPSGNQSPPAPFSLFRRS